MSLILEALKKSEAERGRSQPETAGGVGPAARSSRWVWLALLAIVAVAVAGAWWWLQARPGPGVPTADTAPAASRADIVPATPAVDDPELAGARSATERDSADAAPAPEAVRDTGEAAPSDADPAAEPPAPDAGLAGQADADADSGEPTAVDSTPPEDPVTVDAPTPERRAARTPAPAPRNDAASSYPPVETMADFEARGLINAMKINVHFYAQDPQQRFVLVDLQRRTEGAELAEGVAIHRITPDGVVLDVDGQLYFWRNR